MALRVWLPLTGDLENKGLSNVKVYYNTCNFSQPGKIGSYSCNDRFDLKSNPDFSSFFNQKDFSLGFWAKINEIPSDSSASSVYILQCGSGGTRKVLHIAIRINGAMAFCFYSDDYTFLNSVTPYIDIWTHFMFVYKKGVQYVYINGDLIGSRKTNGDLEIPENSNFICYNKCIQMNDFRIYDEALSVKQIKEISKGLVAHYKLDTTRTLDNLKRYDKYGTYNNFASSGSTCTVVKTGEKYNGADVYRMTYTPNEISISSVKSALSGHGVTTSRQTFAANTKYCYWTLFKLISHPDTRVGGTASNIQGWVEIAPQYWKNGWYIVGQKRTGNASEDKSDMIFTSFKTPSAESGVPIIIDFCCPHLVEGIDYISPEFDYAGTPIIQEKDVSGYHYNGTIYGTLDFNPDTPRYNGSTKFNSGYIHYLPSPIHTQTDEFTISCWFYPTTTNTMCLYNHRTGVGNGVALFYYLGHLRFDDNIQNEFNYTVPLNTWTHIAVTHKTGEYKKCYVNGEFFGQAGSGNMQNIGTNASIGNSSTNGAAGAGNQLSGSLSDFRIYCTALSAEDIKELYQTSAWIDKENNLYTCELKEE